MNTHPYVIDQLSVDRQRARLAAAERHRLVKTAACECRRVPLVLWLDRHLLRRDRERVVVVRPATRAAP